MPGPDTPPPHFLCIGAQKAGTQWLYDQARSHPDVWMPAIKELRFWFGRWGRARREALAKLNVMLRGVWRGDAPPDPRDLEFLRRMWFDTDDESAPGSLKAYRHVFGAAGGAVTGDISPQYARLEESQVADVLAGLPDIPIIYFVREPVSRVWSQVCMHAHWDKANPEVVEQPDALAEFLQLPGVVGMSFQSQVINRWGPLAGDRFRVFTMPEMIADPELFRRRVFEHIGLDADCCTIPADYNKKGSRPKNDLPPQLRQVLIDYLGDEPEALDRALDRVGVGPVTDRSAPLSPR
jgi:hypothetical protein